MVIAPDGEFPTLLVCATLAELTETLKKYDLIDPLMFIYIVQGAKLDVTVAPFRYLVLPNQERVPLFEVPEPGGVEIDDMNTRAREHAVARQQELEAMFHPPSDNEVADGGEDEEWDDDGGEQEPTWTEQIEHQGQPAEQDEDEDDEDEYDTEEPAE